MATLLEAGEGAVTRVARDLAREAYHPVEKKSFGSSPAWQALRATGTRLWLDTGDLDAARKLWTDEFSNLTTNNTLVNKEVQKGLFDEVIPRAGAQLREAGVDDPRELVYEVGFVINCRTALRLVEAFDATVSVELHPGMAGDVARSVSYGRRYFAVCPERFIVKVPLTPAGFLAARQLSQDGIPVNFTLGFSARQNALAAAFSRPAYVNVFMGRLNSFVADNGLGDGKNVGEKATMATQHCLREGRENRGWQSLLIGASMRSGTQVLDLAGLDVFTMPTAAAEEYRQLFADGTHPVSCQLDRRFEVHAEPAAVLDTLWSVDDRVYQVADALRQTDVSGWSGDQFAAFVAEHGLPDLVPAWSREELQQIEADGKVPKWERWKDRLLDGRLGLDELMSVSALESFVKDQSALDERIQRLLRDGGVLA